MKKKSLKKDFLVPDKRSLRRILYTICLVLCSCVLHAQGNLLLFPKRVVFEGADRMRTVSLINTGTDTVTYLVSVVQFRMKLDGNFERIQQPDSGQQFADPFLRIYPRSVQLPPGKAQIVKIQLTSTAELYPGEYRSHLYFRAEPESKPLGEEETNRNASSISVHVTSVFGISIPVIIRTGESTTSVAIAGMKLEQLKDSLCQVKLAIRRSGNMSVYGDVLVDYIPEQGKMIRLGNSHGMAIYTPYTERLFTIPLINKTGVDLKKGRLHITYQTQPDAKSLLLAEADFKLAEIK